MREITYCEASDAANALEFELTPNEYGGMRDICGVVSGEAADATDVPLVSEKLDSARAGCRIDTVKRRYAPHPVPLGDSVKYEVSDI